MKYISLDFFFFLIYKYVIEKITEKYTTGIFLYMRLIFLMLFFAIGNKYRVNLFLLGALNQFLLFLIFIFFIFVYTFTPVLVFLSNRSSIFVSLVLSRLNASSKENYIILQKNIYRKFKSL